VFKRKKDRKEKRPDQVDIGRKIPKQKIPSESDESDFFIPPKKEKIPKIAPSLDTSKIKDPKIVPSKYTSKEKSKHTPPSSSKPKSSKLISNKTLHERKSKKKDKDIPRSSKLRPSKRKDGVGIKQKTPKDKPPRLRKDGIQGMEIKDRTILKSKIPSHEEVSSSPSKRDDIFISRQLEIKEDKKLKVKDPPGTSKLKTPHEKIPKSKIPKEKIPKHKIPKDES
jgi:hypothetical protein